MNLEQRITDNVKRQLGELVFQQMVTAAQLGDVQDKLDAAEAELAKLKAVDE